MQEQFLSLMSLAFWCTILLSILGEVWFFWLLCEIRVLIFFFFWVRGLSDGGVGGCEYHLNMRKIYCESESYAGHSGFSKPIKEPRGSSIGMVWSLTSWGLLGSVMRVNKLNQKLMHQLVCFSPWKFLPILGLM